jgi:probable rRNA maturation factor
LKTLDHADAELSILLTDDAEVQSLNRQYRGKDKATDVLSFPQAASGLVLPGVALDLDPSLGDIVLSLDAVQRQADLGCLSRMEVVLGARARAWSALDEAIFLTLHGILHLLGYDHESPEDADEMESLEARFSVEIFKFSRS